jgi:hypothetical protein
MSGKGNWRPQPHLAHPLEWSAGPRRPLCSVPRLSRGAGRILGALTLPYAHPDPGTAADKREDGALHCEGLTMLLASYA